MVELKLTDHDLLKLSISDFRELRRVAVKSWYTDYNFMNHFEVNEEHKDILKGRL